MTEASEGAVGEVPAIEIRKLAVTYKTGFRRRSVDAVQDLSLSVARGEIFGFVGPNGAGKTSTIRVLMGLMRAARGECRILGEPSERPAARRQLGFLPESPYFYDYLSVFELCDLAGRLFDMPSARRRERADELIDLVGLRGARDQPMRKYSKGMLQRAGIAQALINDPALVVFDEPMSGLDPVGRKQVRDIILSLRDQGKTVFFSTHILTDVERIADRVAIIVGGRVRSIGLLSEVIGQNLLSVEVVFRAGETFDDGARARLGERAQTVRVLDREVATSIAPEVDLDEFVSFARGLSLSLVSVTPRHETLEDVFMRSAAAQQ